MSLNHETTNTRRRGLTSMKRLLPAVILFALLLGAHTAFVEGSRGPEHARNVILFIGDAGGIPTLNAASIHGHQQPHALFVQQMPNVALMDTSAADGWVTDSAAGMSAIVTGVKTNNGVISQSAEAVRGKTDGAALQTILEHAEQRGLSTGILTNMHIADATPAACYAHANDRRNAREIFEQLLTPRFGDGPEVVIGAGRTSVVQGAKALGIDVVAQFRSRGYAWLDSPLSLGADARRAVALTDDPEFDPRPVLDRVMDVLSRNRRGYFLMVEWDMHTTSLVRGLNRVLTMDAMVRQAAARAKDDTLIIYTADHSFDLRVRGGSKGAPLVPPTVAEAAGASNGQPKGDDVAAKPVAQLKAAVLSPNVRVDDAHTGEHVLVAAQGPGAHRVRGFIENTELFRIMMAAFGWIAP